MLLVNTRRYNKHYITMLVGRVKFILKHNILLIIISNDRAVVYKNNILLGVIQIKSGHIATQCECLDWWYPTIWNANKICGNYHLNHKIPYYCYSDKVSIFGFIVTQYAQHRYSSAKLCDNLLNALQ